MRRYSFLLFALMVLLASCGRYVHLVDGRSFDDAAEARALHQQNIARDLRAVTPRGAPIAQAVVVVLPTRDRLERIMKPMFGGAPKEFVDAAIDREEDSALMDADVVRRSNLFADVAVVRSDNAQPRMAPNDGYLLWTRLLADDIKRFILSSGEKGFHELVLDSDTTPAQRAEQWLSQIESYVRTQTPTE